MEPPSSQPDDSGQQRWGRGCHLPIGQLLEGYQDDLAVESVCTDDPKVVPMWWGLCQELEALGASLSSFTHDFIVKDTYRCYALAKLSTCTTGLMAIIDHLPQDCRGELGLHLTS